MIEKARYMLSLIDIALLLYCPALFRHSPADERHPQGRMTTKRYLAKKQVVKSLWIATGTLMLIYPIVPFIVTLGLFTTFLSFTILDESA
ncbi:MAG: hypothetical protein OQK12_11350 [Motiliproteus sp.]|nr:hypothetical protein [Motiliproteus sp.]MCW9052560.1 hypothetical protein [Motiliproteus sp.]